MKRSKDSYRRRADIEDIYRSCSSGLRTLPAHGLLKFLHKEQMELTANAETVVSLINKYEINETARESQSMTFEGFFRYMESKDCSVFDLTHCAVYQDMDQPLNNYFISSSHNTYLTGDQLVGKSDLDAYVSALRKGCRCLEIDCWDGSDQEPIVYHGYTLTSKILFKDVITTIEKHAFEVSAYPVVLSLENHCCQEQQEVMAQHLTSILGDKLLTAGLDQMTAEELPSPNMLMYKILIKNKKLKPHKEGEDEAGTPGSKDEDEDEDEEDEDEEDEDEDEDEEGEEEDEDNMQFVEEEEEAKLKEARGPKRKFLHPKKIKKSKKVKVAQRLSDLVVYTRSVKFVSFSHSKENQSYFENTSMAEKKAHKLAKNSGADFVKHNQRFISRIYPRGARIISSNYNPQEFWNVGAQLVALNFQSGGTPMDLNDGRFQDNGGCGYTLKPAILMSSRAFDPGCSHSSLKPIYLHLKVIGGANLPAPKTKAQEVFVRVEICGIPADSIKTSTKSIKNLLNPHWDAEMNFTIKAPELCLLRFCVRNQTGLTSEFVAQYTLPFTSLKKGYRWVPLRNREGCSLDPASLYVHVWY